MATSPAASKRTPAPPPRIPTRTQRTKSFLRRHQVAFAVYAVALAVLWGVWLALSSPRPLPPGDTGNDLQQQQQQQDDRLVNDPSFIESTQHWAKSWTVGENADFTGISIGVASARLGRALWSGSMEHAPYCPASTAGQDIPDEFDANKVKPQCAMEPHALQLQCAGSWATSATDAISSRLCWANSDHYAGLRMSPQTMLSCVPDVGGCQGGALDYGMVVAMRMGLVTTLCFPYTAKEGVACSDACPHEERSMIEGFCKVHDTNHLKAELMERGPAAVVMTMTDDLLLYKGGVYKPTPLTRRLVTAEYPVTQGAVLLGWGKDVENDEYWLVQTDLGEHWGEQGRARISVQSRVVIDAGAVVPIVKWDDEGDAGAGAASGESPIVAEQSHASSGAAAKGGMKTDDLDDEDAASTGDDESV